MTTRYDSRAGGAPIRTASSANRTKGASASASEYTATVAMPIRRHVRITRSAISPGSRSGPCRWAARGQATPTTWVAATAGADGDDAGATGRAAARRGVTARAARADLLPRLLVAFQGPRAEGSKELHARSLRGCVCLVRRRVRRYPDPEPGQSSIAIEARLPASRSAARSSWSRSGSATRPARPASSTARWTRGRPPTSTTRPPPAP